MPGGIITGAPKPRTMELVDEAGPNQNAPPDSAPAAGFRDDAVHAGYTQTTRHPLDSCSTT